MLSEIDPIAKAEDLKLAARRLKELGEKMLKPLIWISDKAVEKFQQLDQAVVSTEEAEAKAAEILQSNEKFLDGTGGRAWKLLFEAARKFSVEEAYSGCEFPHVEGARCPLCQEQLGDIAGKRLRRCEQYIKDDTARQADEARKKMREARTKIECVFRRKSTGDSNRSRHLIPTEVDTPGRGITSN